MMDLEKFYEVKIWNEFQVKNDYGFMEYPKCKYDDNNPYLKFTYDYEWFKGFNNIGGLEITTKMTLKEVIVNKNKITKAFIKGIPWFNLCNCCPTLEETVEGENFVNIVYLGIVETEDYPFVKKIEDNGIVYRGLITERNIHEGRRFYTTSVSDILEDLQSLAGDKFVEIASI